MTARLLGRKGGHEVKVVYDGPAALEAAPNFQPEVAFLDIGLPGIDGYRLA
jgi:CheY-like chemotaxis protein